MEVKMNEAKSDRDGDVTSVQGPHDDQTTFTSLIPSTHTHDVITNTTSPDLNSNSNGDQISCHFVCKRETSFTTDAKNRNTNASSQNPGKTNEAPFSHNQIYRDRDRPPTTTSNDKSQERIINEDWRSTPSSEKTASCPLIYKLTDSPPPYLMIGFVLQQGLLAIATPLTTAFIVGEVICAGDDDEIKTRILSTTFFMIGLSTFCMVTFGVRLPIFQGPNFTYVLPILSLIQLEEFRCPVKFESVDLITNVTTHFVRVSNETLMLKHDFVVQRINELSGSLIIVGALHCLIGVTGMVGILKKFIGPVTIVPMVFLFGIQIHTVVAGFSETHWPTAALTAGLAILLAVYLEKYRTPIPFWTPSRGFFISWHPLHSVFSIIISIMTGWIVCLVLTRNDVLSADPNSKEYLARTDARFQVVRDIDWFLLPYPGQFGMPRINLTAIIAFFIATLTSILDSIGDYSASARIACAPQPPYFALNRGIAIEGLMVLLGGAFGCGHGTVSFGENIGAMKISRVVSIRVFQACGIMYMIFAFVGKFGAFVITIPHSVMGGSQLITFGMLIGVILSYLQHIDLNSTRNLSILGVTILLGVTLPNWLSANQDSVNTRNVRTDTVIKTILSNPSFVGGIFAAFLDNTVPGTDKERGIFSDHEVKDVDGKGGDHYGSPSSNSSGEELLLHGREVYRLPWLSDRFRKSKFARFVPIFDYILPDEMPIVSKPK